MQLQLVNIFPAFRVSLLSSIEDPTDPRSVITWKLNRHEHLNYVKLSYALKYFKYLRLGISIHVWHLRGTERYR